MGGGVCLNLNKWGYFVDQTRKKKKEKEKEKKKKEADSLLLNTPPTGKKNLIKMYHVRLLLQFQAESGSTWKAVLKENTFEARV